MEVGYAEYRLPRDLAGFEPVKTAPKMPRELGGRGGKITVLDSDLPLPLLKARVTPASYR